MIEASVTLAGNAKLQYLCAILCSEAPFQFDTLCDQEGGTNTTHLNRIILGLVT